MLRGSHGFWFPGPKVDPEAVAPKDFFPIVIFFKDSRALIVKYPPANAGEMGCRFDSWVGKTPWRRARQSTPVFLPGESRGQRSLAGYIVHGVSKNRTRLKRLGRTRM